MSVTFYDMLGIAFDLKGYFFFPRMGREVFGSDIDILDRYVSESKELRRCSVLREPQRVSFNFTPESVDIDQNFLAKDSMRGFIVTFRQFYATDEAASFIRVSNILAKVVRTLWTQEEWNALLDWKSAHGKLLGHSLEYLAIEKQFPGCGIPKPPPNQLISTYLYGDWVHWGDKRQAYEELTRDEVLSAMSHMEILQAALGLAHLYIAYGALVKQVTSEPRA